MRPHFATPMIVSLALAFNVKAQRDPEEVLAQARDRVIERTDRLPNYTCVQTVDRKYLKRTKPELPAPSCDQMSAERTKRSYLLKVEATDRLRLDVKVSAGDEIGSWAGASHFEEGNIGRLVKGPFGTGPFGTFLGDIFTIPSVRFSFVGEEPVDGAKLFRYHFQVPRESSHYMVEAGKDWRVTGYDGAAWIDPDSFELRRLLIRTNELPEETHACEATTTVEYASMRMGAGDFLLPRHSKLHFLMRDTTESEISTTYSSCREFLGEAKLVDHPSVTNAEQARAPRAPISIPAGLSLSLALAEPIDTDTAAAGDAVVAQVSKPVRDPKSGVVVIPAGSKVRGRIVRMEHWQDSPRYFVIALLLETIEVNDIESPFYASLKPNEEERALGKETSGLVARGQPIFLRPRGQSRLVANLVFASAGKRYVMPRGYETKWTTVPELYSAIPNK